MKHYEVTIILDNEKQLQRIGDLEKRFKKYNGWDEQSIMQFGIAAFPEIWDNLLNLLEIKANAMDL